MICIHHKDFCPKGMFCIAWVCSLYPTVASTVVVFPVCNNDGHIVLIPMQLALANNKSSPKLY